MNKLLLLAVLLAGTVQANPNERTAWEGSVVCTSEDALDLVYKTQTVGSECIVLWQDIRVIMLNVSWTGTAEIYYKKHRFFTSSSTIRRRSTKRGQ